MGSDTRSEISHLGKSFRFKGDITGSEDLYIDGQVDGTIQVPGQVVTVGPQGTVNAEVQSRELVIHGKLKGNAKSHDRIEVSRTGSVWGDLAMARISIQEGAFIQGRIDIRSASTPASAGQPSAANAALGVAAGAGTGSPAAAPRVPQPPAPGAPQPSLLDRKL